MSDSATDLINPKVLFHEIGEDRELLRALMETAEADLPRYLEELGAASATSDFMKVQLTAHAMKTTLAHWDAKQAVELVRTVEYLCRDGKGPEAILLVPSVAQAVREVLLALEKVEELL